MEKKQQQWKQENGKIEFSQKTSFLISLFLAEKTPFWNPFGRPGAGAPNTNEVQPKISVRLLFSLSISLQ